MADANHAANYHGLDLFVAGQPLWEQLTASRLNAIIHALNGNRLLFGRGYRKRELGRGVGYTLDIDPGAAAGDEVVDYPWKQYASLWQGTGTDPNMANRAMRFRLKRGKFVALTPSNMSDEFVAFGDASDTEIEAADAVYTQVYIRVAVSESELGSGDITYQKPEIKIVEGDDLIDALGAGSIPNFGSDGSLPSYIIVPICEVAWYGGSLNFIPGVSSYLDCTVVVSGTDCDHAGRDFIVTSS